MRYVHLAAFRVDKTSEQIKQNLKESLVQCNINIVLLGASPLPQKCPYCNLAVLEELQKYTCIIT